MTLLCSTRVPLLAVSTSRLAEPSLTLPRLIEVKASASSRLIGCFRGMVIGQHLGTLDNSTNEYDALTHDSVMTQIQLILPLFDVE